jgi:hypothetical protein
MWPWLNSSFPSSESRQMTHYWAAGPIRGSGSRSGQNELTASAPPSEEGQFVISHSSSASAMRDSSCHCFIVFL